MAWYLRLDFLVTLDHSVLYTVRARSAHISIRVSIHILLTLLSFISLWDKTRSFLDIKDSLSHKRGREQASKRVSAAKQTCA